MHHPTDRIIHTTAFVTPVVEHWLEREIAQWEQNNDADLLSQHKERVTYLTLLIAMELKTVDINCK